MLAKYQANPAVLTPENIAFLHQRIHTVFKEVFDKLKVKMNSKHWLFKKVCKIPITLATAEDFAYYVGYQYFYAEEFVNCPDLKRYVKPYQYRAKTYFYLDFIELIQEVKKHGVNSQAEYMLITNHVYPIYHSLYGVLLPIDPLLSEKLSQFSQDHDFLSLAYGPSLSRLLHRDGFEYLKFQLVDLIAHELYGHGTIHNHTKVGCQDYWLDLFADNNSKKKKFDENLRLMRLWVRSSYALVDEGFAVFVQNYALNELTIIDIENLNLKIAELKALFDSGTSSTGVMHDEYLKHFPLKRGVYNDGLELIQIVANSVIPTCQLNCVTQAVMIAGNVDFGVKMLPFGNFQTPNLQDVISKILHHPMEFNTSVRFERLACEMRQASSYIQSEQVKLGCHRQCKRTITKGNCPINQFAQAIGLPNPNPACK